MAAGAVFRTQLQGLRQREARLTLGAPPASHIPRRGEGTREIRVQTTVGDSCTQGGDEPDPQDRKSRGLNERLRSPFSYRVKENSPHCLPPAPAPLWKAKSYANTKERQSSKEKLGWGTQRRDLREREIQPILALRVKSIFPIAAPESSEGAHARPPAEPWLPAPAPPFPHSPLKGPHPCRQLPLETRCVAQPRPRDTGRGGGARSGLPDRSGPDAPASVPPRSEAVVSTLRRD